MIAANDPFDPFAPGFRADPAATYRHFRRHDPVHWGRPSAPELDGGWYLFRHDDIAFVLNDPRFGTERERVEPTPAQGADAPPSDGFWYWISQWMLFRDPPDHGRLRGVLKDAFSAARVRGMQPLVRTVLRELLDSLAERTEFDVVEDFASLLPIEVVSRLMGAELDDAVRFREYSAQMVRALDLRTTTAVYAAGQQAAAAMAEHFCGVVARRRRSPREDLVTLLVAAERDGRISEQEMIATCLLLTVAGHETTTHYLSNGIHQLLVNPGQLARFRSDPSLDKSMVEEALRVSSPVQMVPRLARADVEIRGKRIRAGDDVTLILASANRDEAVYEDPDEFNLHRAPGAQSAFGMGAHFCLGAVLARLEGKLAFREFVNRFPRLELQADGASWNDRIAFRGLSRLPVLVGPR